MGLICPPRISHLSPTRKDFSFWPCYNQLVWSRWLDIGLVVLCFFIDLTHNSKTRPISILTSFLVNDEHILPCRKKCCYQGICLIVLQMKNLTKLNAKSLAVSYNQRSSLKVQAHMERCYFLTTSSAALVWSGWKRLFQRSPRLFSSCFFLHVFGSVFSSLLQRVFSAFSFETTLSLPVDTASSSSRSNSTSAPPVTQQRFYPV